jgi:GT2 family glycosyltransferase
VSDTRPALDLSVVMINWNALPMTAAALESLREQTQGIDYEVFVVDNGSTRDASVAELPRRFPWVRFLANPANLGFSRANNQAIRAVRGRYVLLLNNDTLQTENALGEAVRYLDGHPAVGALGILHRNHDAGRSFQPSFSPFPNPLGDILGLLGLGGDPPPPPAVVEQDVDWVCGSFLMIRRACLEQVGGLDERFFSYDEDIDWCRRAKQAGWAVRFWPGASLIHLGSGSLPSIKDKTAMMFRSHLTYIRKHHSAALAALYYLAVCGRLTAAGLKQLARYAAGRVGFDEVRRRWRRQIQFVLLKPARAFG